MQETDLLSRLGIPEKAARAYLSLVSAGDATVSELARRAGLHRAECYRFLPFLREKGLAAPMNRGKRTIWRAAPPAALSALRREFDESFDAALSRLSAAYESIGLRAELTHGKGPEAVGKVYLDSVRLTPPGGVYFRFNARRDPSEPPHGSVKEYMRIRKEKAISRMVIIGEEGRKFWAVRDDRDPTREVVSVPAGSGLLDDDISKFIYADRVSVVDHALQETFTIRNARFARFEARVYRLLFKLLKEKEASARG